MRAFSYYSPGTMGEALSLLGHGARPLAGGTDLLTLMKADLERPQRLVDIKRMTGMERGIRHEGGELAIGALTPLTELERHAEVLSRFAALAQAAAAAATPQLRNMATLGGNLLQRPRCWYFRSPHVRCWLKGGPECQARDGENRGHAIFEAGPCRAVHPSDLAPALLALDADLRVHGRGGERVLRLEGFFRPPEEARRVETVLEDGELILAVKLPPPPEGTRSVYLQAMDRKAWSFALASVAAVLRRSGGKIAHARIVLGGVAPVPWRCPGAERVLVGAHADGGTFERAAQAAVEEAAPLRHNGYKVPLARALVRQALQSLIT